MQKIPPTVEKWYQSKRAEKTDIQGHLDALRDMARRADSVLEIGTRRGFSTAAFIASGARIVDCLDMTFSNLAVDDYKRHASEMGCRLRLFEGDSCTFDMKYFGYGMTWGMVFIDGFHTYANLSVELARYHSKALDVIAIHDTVLFGDKGEAGQAGIMPAVVDFIKTHPEWDVTQHYEHCNGLTVLEKVI